MCHCHRRASPPRLFLLFGFLVLERAWSDFTQLLHELGRVGLGPARVEPGRGVEGHAHPEVVDILKTAIELCVPIAGLDVDPPALAGSPTITPAVGKLGTLVTVSFAV